MNKTKQIIYLSSVFFILSVSILTIYSNTFTASWQLDDTPNILNNYHLHIKSLDWESLKKTFYTNPHNPYELQKKFYRPIPCITFALNWYFGQDNVFGYHVVNITLHILTSCILFLVITNLFKTPNLKKIKQNNVFIISIFATLLWAANPIQTQAVTYIVQRMAQMAAFFYILGIYAYLKGRIETIAIKRVFWVSFCLFLYPLAIYSKSNAIMLPLALLLIELIFFQDLSDKKSLKRIVLISLTASVFILTFGSIAFFKGDPLSFLNLYDYRTFTLTERLLAEPRVLLFYLSQIFFPLPNRFSIAHDVVLSSSFLHPWTTIPSILVIISLIFFALLVLRKSPLLSFAILFYFLNHIIESSIIALEIIFEHRNYLPSFFLFLPFVSAVFQNQSGLLFKERTIHYLKIISLLVFLIISLSGTYVRNRVWKDSITLWTDAVSKAPNDARALNTLAIKLAWSENSSHPKRYDMALKLFETSLDKHIATKYVKADILGNMATIYFYHKNDREKGLSLYRAALDAYPLSLKIRKDYASALIVAKEFQNAELQVDILLETNDKNGTYHNLKGHTLLWQKKYSAALICFEKAYKMLPGAMKDKLNIILNTVVALSLAGEHEKAENISLKAIKVAPKDIAFHFALIENSIRSKQNNKTNEYVKLLSEAFSQNQIIDNLEKISNNPQLAPLSKQHIESALNQKL